MNEKLEDSPDLTDEEIALAVDTTDAEISARMFSVQCKCGHLHDQRHSKLRRRRPYHYAILDLGCPVCKDTQKLVMRLTGPRWRLQ